MAKLDYQLFRTVRHVCSSNSSGSVEGQMVRTDGMRVAKSTLRTRVKARVAYQSRHFDDFICHHVLTTEQTNLNPVLGAFFSFGAIDGLG